MKIVKRIVLCNLLFLAVAPQLSLAQSALLDQAKVLFKPIPDTAQAVSGDSSNAAMVELGKALYFDPRLSKSHRFLNRRA